MEGFSSSTICSHLSAVAYHAQLAGFPDPTQSFLVRRLTLGCKKHSPSQDERLPLLLPQVHSLVRLCPTLHNGRFDIVLYQALFLFIFHGFFRVGEVLPGSFAMSARVVQYQDVVVIDGTLRVTLRHHKTQTSGRPTILCISSSRSQYCPCHYLLCYFQLRGAFPGPLFVDCTGRAITLSKFRSVLSQSLIALGLPVHLYKPHSFRIGACTQAIMSGVPPDQVQSMGRWRSHAYKKYIRLPRVSI